MSVYRYEHGVFHPRCLIGAMIDRGALSPVMADAATDEVLWQFTQANAVTAEDADAEWLPRQVPLGDVDGAEERACSGCDRLLSHDVSITSSPDPIDQALAPARAAGAFDGTSGPDLWERGRVSIEAPPRTVMDVNRAMDLPLPEGRALLGQVLDERRRHATHLREVAERPDATETVRSAYRDVAAHVDDQITDIEQVAAWLERLVADGELSTGREQIERELGSRDERGAGRDVAEDRAAVADQGADIDDDLGPGDGRGQGRGGWSM